MISIYELVAFSIDFEGEISLAKTLKKNGTPHFQAHVKINNNLLELLQSFQRTVRFGSVSPTHLATSMFAWWLSPDEMRQYLPQIEPHLTLKAEQAVLLLQALRYITPRHVKGVTSSCRPSEEVWVLNDLHEQLRILNTKPSRRVK